MIQPGRFVTGACLLGLTIPALGGAAEPAADRDRQRLIDTWRGLPVPPITPYSGPFGGEARGFVGKLPKNSKLYGASFDWKRLGTYDPADDPRPIDMEFEQAVLEDWRRMGYNCAYKGNTFTFRSGRFLKANGMLGAIDQTLFGANGPPPLTWDGKDGPRQREACGSFFHPDNYSAGVQLLTNFVHNYGDKDMFRVGDTYITCSWDEVGMRTRSMLDYRPEAITEYRRFLKEVWFQDDGPGRDSNGDGRTYNVFAGEQLASWDEVKPPALSPRFHLAPQPVDQKWDRPGAYKLWLDFHRYYTFEFFRRINADVSRQLGPRDRLECYPFPQAFLMWPGMNAFWGLSPYWNGRLNPIVNVEQCWPDSPAMSINYAMTDRLARKYQNIVMGWSWFYFGKEGKGMYDGPYDNGRALARMMGRRVDGIHHWLYSPIYRGRDQHQRLQIAYWHNFLGHHYASFLSKSEPVPAQVAILMPDWTGYFYRMFNYPKMDFSYLAQGLQEAQIPHEVVFEEELELEADALKPYKVLYVIGSEWTTPTIQKRIEAFIQAGGVVCANVDSLTLDISSGRRTDFLEKTFGVRLDHKYKNSFLPSTQTAEEEEWAAQLNGWGKPTWLQGHHVHLPDAHARIWKVDNGQVVPEPAEWKKLDEAMARLPGEVRGLRQSPLNMRQPPMVRYARGIGPATPTATYSEINTAQALRGQPIAWYGEQVCGVETERTVWLGVRPGMDLHAVSPRMSMNQTTEPCNPYVTRVSDDYATHQPYVDVCSYAARKAGVQRLVTLTLEDRVPCNLEVLPRSDGAGNLMVFVINHDATDAVYQVAVAADHLARVGTVQAWDLLGGKLIEEKTDGRFALRVEPWKVAVFLVGNEAGLAPIKAAQARLKGRDLSVPKYFADRPELNTAEWDTPLPQN